MTFRVHVRVVPRAGLLDPQGQAVDHALGALGFTGVKRVRVGRAVELDLAAASKDEAEAHARRMFFLFNDKAATEDYTIEVEED